MPHLVLVFVCLAFAGAGMAEEPATVHTEMDKAFGTFMPPNEIFPQNREHVVVSTSIMLAIALFFLVVSVFDSRKFKSIVPVGMVLGAAFCVVPEAIDNYLGGVYWSQSHIPGDIMFVLMGREFDWYVAIMWWAFGAILGYILYAALLRRVKTRTLWICLILSGIADIVVEELLLGYGGIYTYYGDQPLVLIRHFPCWWLFVNVASLFLSVTIAYRFRSWFNGWHSVFILLLHGRLLVLRNARDIRHQRNIQPVRYTACRSDDLSVSVIMAGATMYLVL